MLIKIHYMRASDGKVYCDIIHQDKELTQLLRHTPLKYAGGWELKSSAHPEVNVPSHSFYVMGGRGEPYVLPVPADLFETAVVNGLKALADTGLSGNTVNDGDIERAKTNFDFPKIQFILTSEEEGLRFMVLRQDEDFIPREGKLPVLKEGVKLEKDFISLRATDDADPWKESFLPFDDFKEQEEFRREVISSLVGCGFTMDDHYITVG